MGEQIKWHSATVNTMVQGHGLLTGILAQSIYINWHFGAINIIAKWHIPLVNTLAQAMNWHIGTVKTMA